MADYPPLYLPSYDDEGGDYWYDEENDDDLGDDDDWAHDLYDGAGDPILLPDFEDEPT